MNSRYRIFFLDVALELCDGKYTNMNDLGYIHLRIFLKVIPKGHLSGKVAVHQCCAGDTWYIMLEDEEMKKRLSKLFI